MTERDSSEARLDGRYRVVRGVDGHRVLYFFPPDGVPRDIVLDKDDDEPELQVLISRQVKGGTHVEPWSTAEFEALLDDLEDAAAHPEPAFGRPLAGCTECGAPPGRPCTPMATGMMIHPSRLRAPHQ